MSTHQTPPLKRDGRSLENLEGRDSRLDGGKEASTSTSASDDRKLARAPYVPPSVSTRPLFERLALSCEHAVDPDTGELIIGGPS